MSALPHDPAIPALVAANDRGLAWVLEQCGLSGGVTDAHGLRHHQGSRCTLKVVGGDGQVVLKCYRRDPAEQVAMLHRIADAGLGQARGPSITVPMGYSAKLACFVTRWFDGPTALDLVDRGDGARLGELAAAWFAAAVRVRPDGFAPYGPADMRVDLGRWLDDIDLAHAELGAVAMTHVEGLAGATPRGTPGLLQLTFSVSHIVDLGEGPGILDWDGPAYGPLEIDAGGFLATLCREATLRPSAAATVAMAAQTFADRLADTLDADLIWWARTAALVKQAKHACTLQRPGWRETATALLDAV